MLRAWAAIGSCRYVCDIARTPREQQTGLQALSHLEHDGGMLFPFPAPRATSFWMGKVAFPIDLAFADEDLRIVSIVRNARPGTNERWSPSKHVSAVLEVNAGALRAARPGDALDTPYTPVDLARFIDKSEPPEGNPDAVDGLMPHYREQFGYDPKTPSDIVDLDPDAPSSRSAQVTPDTAAIAATVAATFPLVWQPDRLNGGATQSATISPRGLISFLSPAVETEQDRDELSAIAASSAFMRLLGDALIIAEKADMARVHTSGLTVWRGSA